MARQAKTVQQKTTKPESHEEIVLLPLGAVKADFDWNCRSGDFRTAGGLEEEHEFRELIDSILEKGQTTAVVVRPSKDGKYALVEGFRRYAALQSIEKMTRAEPKIKAIIRQMSDAEAAHSNALENIGRQNLKRPADVSFAIRRIRDLQRHERTFKNESKLAEGLGMKQAWCNKLLRISDDVLPEIFVHWRSAKVPLTVDQMLAIAKLPIGEQFEAYQKLAEKRQSEPTQGGPGRAGNAYERAERAAKKVAVLLGTLEVRGLANYDDSLYTEHLRVLLPEFDELDKEGNPKLEDTEWASLAEVAKREHNDTVRMVLKVSREKKAAE